MTKFDPASLNLPPLTFYKDFARLVGLSPDTIRRCANGTAPANWPPLDAKRMPDGRLYITAAAGAAWINSLPDA